MHRRTPLLVTAAALLVLAGCAASDGTATSSSSSPTASGSASGSSAEDGPTQETVEITVSVRDGTVTPEPHRVDVPLGSQVRLQVTSDVDDEVHVHGFEVEEPLEAGRTTTLDLTADQQGVFEVEAHETELELLQLEVR